MDNTGQSDAVYHPGSDRLRNSVDQVMAGSDTQYRRGAALWRSAMVYSEHARYSS